MRARDRIHRLAGAIERFRSEGDVLRERLLSETPHMSPETMAAGLDLSLGPWDETGLSALWSEEQPYLGDGIFPDLAVVILGGVLPPSHVQAIAYPYLLGAEVIVKHPSADALFPSLFAEALGPGITVVGRLGLGGLLSRADAAIAVGEDESVRSLACELPASTPFLGFGHQTAVTVVLGTPAAGAESVAESIARDILCFDQLGCLSPREVFVLGDFATAANLASSLARAMKRSAAPRKALGPAIEAAIRLVREEALVAGEPVLGPDDLQWGVIASRQAVWTGTPGGRHVIVRPVPRLSQLPEALSPMAGHLSAVGVAGGDLDDGTVRALARLGASRVVPAGELQTPPPTWPHDGRRPLASLCRWVGRA